MDARLKSEMIRLNSKVIARARSVIPEYDTMTAQLSRLGDVGLDSMATMIEGRQARDLYNNNISNNINKEKEKSTKSTAKRRDPYSAKVLKDDLIPEDLKECTELFTEWWSARHKKGATCSSKIAEREFSKLRAWSKVNRISALQKAIYKPWMQLYAVTDAQAAETAPSAPRLKDFTGAAAKMRADQNNNPLSELF